MAQRSWQIKYDKIRKQQRNRKERGGREEGGIAKSDHKQLDYDNNPRCSPGTKDRETRLDTKT